MALYIVHFSMVQGTDGESYYKGAEVDGSKLDLPRLVDIGAVHEKGKAAPDGPDVNLKPMTVGEIVRSAEEKKEEDEAPNKKKVGPSGAKS